MKLKKLLFTIGLCCCLSVTAQETTNALFMQNATIEPKLHPVKTAEPLRNSIFPAPARLIKGDIKCTDSRSPWTAAGEVENKAARSDTRLRLDSVIGTNPDGSNYTRQYFVFNDRNKIVKLTNSYWNTSLKSWETAEEYDYQWDEDGYILMLSVKGYGQGRRTEFVYNEKKLGIEQVMSELDENEWIKKFKGEYKYDDSNNMIDELLYAWSENKWIKTTHNTASWDNQNRQTSIVSMEWDGTDWIGANKQDYVWHAKDQLSYKGMWLWLSETKEWRLVQKFLQEFNENGLCTAQRMRFWNDERQDWTGEYPSWGTSEICTSYDAEITYDEKGRTILQQHKDWYNSGTEKFLSSEMITEWTDGLENGDYEGQMNAYLYDYGTKKKTWNQREYTRYNSLGLKTWDLQQIQNTDGTQMNDLFEDKFGYDERGNLTYSATWDWVDGVRKPTIEEKNSYDADNNIIESYYRGSLGTPFGGPEKAAGHEPKDDEGWTNTSHFTYKYENGCRVEKLGYRWNGTDWGTNFGEATEFDWNTPASDLITIDDYKDPYKVDFTYSYAGDQSTNWLTTTNAYYYSEQNYNDIRQIQAYQLLFSDNILTVNGGKMIENDIYDSTGRLVYQGNSPQENLSHLYSGIYVVRNTTDGNVSTMKIVIR